MILFDVLGKLSLNENAENMAANYIVKDDTAEDFSYTSTIDSNTSNQIRLTLKGKKGIVQEYFKKNEDSVSKWGVLQYTGSIEEGEDGNVKALSILNTHSKAQRSLSISGAFGDINVRAGSIIYVRTDKTGDIALDEAMTVNHAGTGLKWASSPWIYLLEAGLLTVKAGGSFGGHT